MRDDLRDYVCVCHGCGAIHIVRCYFLSVPSSYLVNAPDGQKWAIPAHGCKECMKLVDGENPIRRAFLHGMTSEASARAEREFSEKFDSLPLRNRN